MREIENWILKSQRKINPGAPNPLWNGIQICNNGERKKKQQNKIKAMGKKFGGKKKEKKRKKFKHQN